MALAESSWTRIHPTALHFHHQDCQVLPGICKPQHFWKPISTGPLCLWPVPGQVTAFVAPVTSARAVEKLVVRGGLPVYGSIIEIHGGGFLEYSISLNIISTYQHVINHFFLYSPRGYHQIEFISSHTLTTHFDDTQYHHVHDLVSPTISMVFDSPCLPCQG